MVVSDLAELRDIGADVIRERAYPVDPWRVRETRLDLDVLAQSESVFALSNGHIGMRGNLDEGEPHGLPGTYLNSFYELRPLPYGESGYGYPESGQTIVNVTNGKLMRLLVDDEPFDVRYGDAALPRAGPRLRAGTLERTVEWLSPAGQAVQMHVHPAGLVHPAGRSRRSATRSSRSTAPARIDRAVGAGGQRGAAAGVRRTPGSPAALEAPLRAEEHLATGPRRCWCTAPG